MKSEFSDSAQSTVVNLPLQFVLLCELLSVNPETVINDLLSSDVMIRYDLGHEHQQLLTESFLRCGHGQEHYRPETIRTMIGDLCSAGFLHPEEGSPEFMSLHKEWHGRYLEYWFEKWKKMK